MRTSGIINAALARGLARLRHTDLVVVADAGLPVPPGPQVVDLAVVYGLPRFDAVLRAVLDEIVVEGALAAEEVVGANASTWTTLRNWLPDVDLVSHDELKRMTAGSVLVVRTGEDTPYANVVLRCGVPF